MAFSETLKSVLRRQADMRCCVCHTIGVEIHHIIPEADGGGDSPDNAAPLCPSCHDIYGANPVKRKFIRECKENWLEACDHRRESLPELSELIQLARRAATREDVRQLLQEHAQGLDTSTGPAPQSLGRVLQQIYDCAHDPTTVRECDIEFAFAAMYGTPWRSDEETEEVRLCFLRRFGAETARRLCVFALRHDCVVRFADGFTDDDLQRLLGVLLVNSILLLHHSDLRPEDFGLELAVTTSGQLWGRLVAEKGSESEGVAPSNQPLQPSSGDAVAGASRSVLPAARG